MEFSDTFRIWKRDDLAYSFEYKIQRRNEQRMNGCDKNGSKWTQNGTGRENVSKIS